MTILHNTLLLDWSTWDLVVDASGNIAMASAPYAVSQDVASQLKTFRGECWYDTSQGVPYWQQILGFRPPAALVAADLEEQALRVPDVVSATALIGGTNVSRGLISSLTATDSDSSTYTFTL